MAKKLLIKDFSDSTPSTPYAHPIHTLRTPYPHPIHTLSTPYPHPIHTLFTPYPHPIHTLRTPCSHPAHTLLTPSPFAPVQVVAKKLLIKGISDFSKLETEVALCASLRHGNIVQVLHTPPLALHLALHLSLHMHLAPAESS